MLLCMRCTAAVAQPAPPVPGSSLTWLHPLGSCSLKTPPGSAYGTVGTGRGEEEEGGEGGSDDAAAAATVVVVRGHLCDQTHEEQQVGVL